MNFQDLDTAGICFMFYSNVGDRTRVSCTMKKNLTSTVINLDLESGYW